MLLESDMERLLKDADFSRETNQKVRLYAILFGRLPEESRQTELDPDLLAAAAGGKDQNSQILTCPLCGEAAELTEDGRHRCLKCGNEW